MPRVALYARVSTEEQAKSGYSIDEQMHQLEAHALVNDFGVVERLVDEGYSGASAERPGLNRIMELAEAGEIDLVLATKRDRLFRSRLYRLLWDQDLDELGVKMVSINDTGNRLADGFQDEFSQWEREQITQRTMAGKMQKARSGKIVATRFPAHGFRYSEDRDHYEVDEAAMASVRRIFQLISSGTTVSQTRRILEAEGFPAPRGKRWLRPAVREIVFDDTYRPHSYTEVAELVSPEVATRLNPELSYGVWWFNRRESVKTRKGRRIRYRSPEEWIAVPVPDSGVPRSEVDEARRVLSRNERKPKSAAAGREWELSGGILRCAECGRAMQPIASSTYHTLKSGERKRYVKYHYRCDSPRLGGQCSMTRTFAAGKTEAKVWEIVRGAMLDPERLSRDLAKTKPRKKDTRRLEAVQARLVELEKRRDGLVDLAADGDIPRSELREKLPPLDAQIAALKKDLEALRQERERQTGAEEDLRIFIARRKNQAPDVLDSLDAAGRHKLYRGLDLKVLAYPDRSLTLTWLANLDLGEIRRNSDGRSVVSITLPTWG